MKSDVKRVQLAPFIKTPDENKKEENLLNKVNFPHGEWGTTRRLKLLDTTFTTKALPPNIVCMINPLESGKVSIASKHIVVDINQVKIFIWQSIKDFLIKRFAGEDNVNKIQNWLNKLKLLCSEFSASKETRYSYTNKCK